MKGRKPVPLPINLINIIKKAMKGTLNHMRLSIIERIIILSIIAVESNEEYNDTSNTAGLI